MYEFGHIRFRIVRYPRFFSQIVARARRFGCAFPSRVRGDLGAHSRRVLQ